MALIAYHASHEQFKPSELLNYAVKAQQAGFTAIHSSEHFVPWSKNQGESGFSFAWMGAVLQATSIPCGMICAPGYRYHPAVVAQAIATYGEMFPGRYWIELGSGEAMNEVITGIEWPYKTERNARLLECVRIIRRMLKGETVTHNGLVNTWNAKLYTRPEEVPMIMGAAISVETAAWLGKWSDGLVTVHKPLEELKEMLQAFDNAGGKGKKRYLKVQLSYARDYQSAADGAFEQWRNNVIAPEKLGDLYTVEDFEEAGKKVTIKQVEEAVHISPDLNYHLNYIREYIKLGFDCIVLHNVNRDQETFINDFSAVINDLKAG